MSEQKEEIERSNKIGDSAEEEVTYDLAPKTKDFGDAALPSAAEGDVPEVEKQCKLDSVKSKTKRKRKDRRRLEVDTTVSDDEGTTETETEISQTFEDLGSGGKSGSEPESVFPNDELANTRVMQQSSSGHAATSAAKSSVDTLLQMAKTKILFQGLQTIQINEEHENRNDKLVAPVCSPSSLQSIENQAISFTSSIASEAGSLLKGNESDDDFRESSHHYPSLVNFGEPSENIFQSPCEDRVISPDVFQETIQIFKAQNPIETKQIGNEVDSILEKSLSKFSTMMETTAEGNVVTVPVFKDEFMASAAVNPENTELQENIAEEEQRASASLNTTFTIEKADNLQTEQVSWFRPWSPGEVLPRPIPDVVSDSESSVAHTGCLSVLVEEEGEDPDTISVNGSLSMEELPTEESASTTPRESHSVLSATNMIHKTVATTPSHSDNNALDDLIQNEETEFLTMSETLADTGIKSVAVGQEQCGIEEHLEVPPDYEKVIDLPQGLVIQPSTSVSSVREDACNIKLEDKLEATSKTPPESQSVFTTNTINDAIISSERSTSEVSLDNLMQTVGTDCRNLAQDLPLNELESVTVDHEQFKTEVELETLQTQKVSTSAGIPHLVITTCPSFKPSPSDDALDNLTQNQETECLTTAEAFPTTGIESVSIGQDQFDAEERLETLQDQTKISTEMSKSRASTARSTASSELGTVAPVQSSRPSTVEHEQEPCFSLESIDATVAVISVSQEELDSDSDDPWLPERKTSLLYALSERETDSGASTNADNDNGGNENDRNKEDDSQGCCAKMCAIV